MRHARPLRWLEWTLATIRAIGVKARLDNRSAKRMSEMTTIWTWVNGFMAGLVAWFLTNYWGRLLLKFCDLRLEAHEAMFLSASIRADIRTSQVRVQEYQNKFLQLAAQFKGLNVVLTEPIKWWLHFRKYDLDLAAHGLVGLSNWIGVSNSEAARFRVEAQKGLRLPIDLEEQEIEERRQRLEGAKF